MAKKNKMLMMYAKWLVIIGAIAWGIFGVSAFAGSPFNIVDWLLGWAGSWLPNAVYTLVGLSGLMLLKEMY